MPSPTLTLLGGANEVGKSGYLLSAESEALLFDYGLQMTEPLTFPEVPEKVDSVVLSHAHLDHSGGLPYLRKRKYFAVYGLDVTFDVARLLLHDSVKVNELKKLHQYYSDGDVDRLEDCEISLKYGKERKLGEEFKVTLSDAGHIPGSSGVLAEVDDKKIFYSGDTKSEDTFLLSRADYPKADVLISESTYGDRLHPDRDETVSEFLSSVEDTCDRGGVSIIPSFAVGRSQEILMMLDSLPYPVYLDGMSKSVIKIFLNYPEYLRDPDLLQKAANNAKWVYNSRTRREAVKEPCVIVTTAGMLTGGPVLDYLSRAGKNPKNSVLLVGYQVEGTNGRRLLEEGYVIDEQIDKRIPVKAQVHFFDFSAHSDQNDLIEMADEVSPEKIVLVHGQEESRQALAEKLSEKYEVYTPQNGEKIDLSL